jgi:transglutaminase-like putative cysteine protease
VGKASLLTAAARAAGIPARIGFADVRNHLCTPRLRALMGTDTFVYHGYTDLYLDGAG